MAVAEAISPGLLILLIFLQSSLAQQCLNNIGYKNTAAGPQQSYQMSNCAANQIAQNGINYNQQQSNTQQVYQQSNIQQAPYQTNSVQPQINYQQGSSQQSANLITNSQPSKQQNQDLNAIFSALYNIRQSPQNQRSNANGNPSQQNNEQFSPQNQVNPTFMATTPVNKPQNSQPISTLYSEAVNFQPTVVYQPVSSNNVSPQQNQQVYAIPVHKVSEEQSQRYSSPDPPLSNSVTNQQMGMQNSLMVPSSQTASVQSQPIILSVQPSQVASVPNQPVQSQNQNQPTVYTVQTQPTSSVNQNQQIVETPYQQPSMNNMPMDKQSLMSYVMSQVQGSQGGGNPLASTQGNPLASMLSGVPQGGSNPLTSILPGIQGGGNPIASLLPAMLGSKAEKSSSMKTILPLILTLLNDRRGGFPCPNCGYNNNQNNEFIKPEPVINTGYSNQINYSQQNPVEVFAKLTDQSDKSEKLTQKETTPEKIPTKEAVNKSPENSEEEEAFESEEDYDEE